MRRKRQRFQDDLKLHEEERSKLLKKVKQTDPKKAGTENLQSRLSSKFILASYSLNSLTLLLSHFEKKKKVTKCSICQDVLKNPKTLGCVHSFCLECLEAQTEKGISPFIFFVFFHFLSFMFHFFSSVSSIGISANPPYRCGLCTAPFVVPLGGLVSLKTSPLLVDLLSASSSLPGPSASASFDPNDVKCELCEDNEEATFRCRECDQFLGSRCVITHRKSKSSAHHQLQPIGEYFSESGSKEAAPSVPVPRCQKHPILETDVFCKSCSAVCCAKCAVESHAKHDYRPLGEENERLQGELIELTSAIAVREKEAAKGRKIFVQAPGKLAKGKKTAAEELRRAFVSLRDRIDSREAEMLGKLEDRCCEVEKMTELEKEEIDFALAEFKGYREMNETVLSVGTDVEVATGHSMVGIQFPLWFIMIFFFECFLSGLVDRERENLGGDWILE